MSNETVSEPEIAEEVVGPDESGADVKAVATLDDVDTALAILDKNLKGVEFDLATVKGNKSARQIRQRLVKLRTRTDALRLENNAPHQAAIDSNNAKAKDIKTRILALENPLDAQIAADEKRREREKAEREEADRVRIAEIRARIALLSEAPLAVAQADSATIAAALDLLIKMVIDETNFAELAAEAEGVRMRADAQLVKMLDAAKAREAEDARRAEERAELDRQRIALEEQQRVAREEAARLQAERDAHEATLLAERKRIDDEVAAAQKLATDAAAAALAAQAQADAAVRAAEQRKIDLTREQQEREARELRRQQDAFEEEKRVERERIAAEAQAVENKRQADLAAEEQAAALRRAAADAAHHAVNPPQIVGSERPELTLVGDGDTGRPADMEILTVLAQHFDISMREALEWVTSFDVDGMAHRLEEAA